MPRLVHRRSGFVRSKLVVLPNQKPRRKGPSTGRSPKAPSTTGNEQQRIFMRHKFMRMRRNSRAGSVGDQYAVVETECRLSNGDWELSLNWK